MPNSLIIGGQSAIAQAISKELESTHQVITISRKVSPKTHHFCSDYTENSLADLFHQLESYLPKLEHIICCTGILHDESVFPERKLSELTSENLAHYFQVNSILPALILRYIVHKLPRKNATKVIFLSAKIGSIEDNKLGGWYGYRASKAALNMLVKTASIELQRTHPLLKLIALHPGTTQSPLSEPFERRIPKDKLYSPEQTSKRLLDVIFKTKRTGVFLNWDGTPLPW